MSKQDRARIVEFAKMDWDRMTFHGMTWKSARKEVEKDYEMTDEEKLKFRKLVFAEMERQQEVGIA